MTKQLVINALKKAYENEQPDAGCIFQSDQGSQYCSQAFQETLQEYQLRSSTSSVVPTQTWQPAAVSEINYQDWQSRVNRYSEKLTLILGRSSNDKITK